jgi:hypothetical protein
MLRTGSIGLAVVIAAGAGVGTQVTAQSIGNGTRPSVGATGGMSPLDQPRRMLGDRDTAAKVHLDPIGKPCLAVRGSSAAGKINPNVFNHMIDVTNACPQRIKMQVCYYQSQHCVAVDVPPYGRQQAVLGVMPAMKDFRFEYREQF